MPAAKQFSGHPPIRVLPDGRKQIVRETPVIFPSTGVALVDTELFLAWGTPDTEFTSLRLVDQDIRRGGDQDGEKSVLVQTFTEIPAYDATPTSEIQVGRDRYEKDANNRRVLIREFIQLSAATFTAGAAGTILTISPDKFALETVSSFDNGAIRTISRRYVEVGDTYAQVGPDVLERTASGLLRVRRLYVAKVGAAALSLEIGVTGGPGTTILAAMSDEGSTLAVARLQLTYLEPGLLSQTDDYSNNGALHVRTITSFNQVPSTPSGFTLVATQASEVEGIPTRAYRFAKGVGEISRETDLANNGLLERVTIRHLTAPGGTDPVATLSGYVRISVGKAEADGHLAWTATFAKGVGVVSLDTETKFNGALVITTRTTLTAPGASAPTALTGQFSQDKQERDGHIVWVQRGAVGTGIVDDNTQARYGGKLSLRTVSSIGTATHAAGEIEFTADARDGYTFFTSRGVSGSGRFSIDSTTTQGGAVTRTTIRFINTDDTAKPAGALTATGIDQEQGYAIYTEVYTSVPTAGGGAGGYASEDISYRFGGALKYTTRTAYNATAPTPAGTQVLVKTETSNGDGFTINTRTWVEVVTVDLAPETQARLGGALTITTKRRFGSAPSAPAGGALISSRVDEGEGYALYTSVFASGTGNIDSENSLRLNGALRYTTYRSLNTAPTGTAGTLVRSETNDGEGHTLYTYTYCEIVTADLADETQARLGGALTITTKRRFGSAPSAPAGGALISSRVDEGEGYALYTSVFASGTGNIDSENSLRLNGALRYTTYRSLNTAPTGTAGTLVRSETNDGEGHTLYTYTYCEIVTADLADETSSKLDGKLTLTTKRKLGTAPASPGAGYAQVSARVDEGEGYVLHTVVFASGTGPINADEVRYRYNGRLTITTKRSLNVAPTAPGGTYVTLISTEISQGDGYAVYTYTWVSGSGLIDETTDTRTDGSQVHVITRLNDPTTGGTVPVGSYLANRDAEPGDGFIIYTLQYYTPPIGYTVPGVRVVTKPGVMTVTSSGGVVPARQPEIVAITTSIAVTFTATPTVGSYTPIKGGGIAYERVNFASGEKLRSTTAFGSDFYSSGEVISGTGDYRGEANASYVCSVVGAADQSGSVVTFGYDAVPFFRSAGVTIFKQTRETGTL